MNGTIATCVIRILSVACIGWGGNFALGSDLLEAQPLTNQIVLLHFKDGHIEYHHRGEPRESDKVFSDPLDVEAAAKPSSYTVQSADDPAFRTAVIPSGIGRKSKGTEFAGKAAVPNHVKEHWIYLELPAAMQNGKTYVIHTGTLAKSGAAWKLTFDPAKARSEAVHVNAVGYVPAAPEKFAYVYHWMGDKGSLALADAEKRTFSVVDLATGRSVFSGKVKFRMGKENPETFQKSDSPPFGNYLKADVWECDFSAFQKPGRYVVSVDGIGCSWPFRIDGDVYREPYTAVIRALYHNRSGIALTKPYTTFERPAPHNPKLTPGFSGRLFYTPLRYMDWGSEGGNPEVLRASFKGNLTETWGWYQDAGDWDGYYTHLRVAQELLFAYEMGPKKFQDRDANIPESGNGVPDLLDEAAWLPRYCQRLRKELLVKGWGTGGIGLRVTGDAFGPRNSYDRKQLPDGTMVGQGSWEDVNRDWVVSGEDPWSTYRYAGVAAHLAYALQLAGCKDPQGVDWEKEAREAYAWAQKNTRPEDEAQRNLPPSGSIVLAQPRAYAAAALFRITGDRSYEQQFMADTASVKATEVFWGDKRFGLWLYALGGGKGKADPATLERIRASVLKTSETVLLTSSSKRALRWGGAFGMPMLCGQQTTPWVLDGAVGYTLTKNTDSDTARRYLAALYTSCDYFLGTNALNQVWISGVGPRSARNIMRLDSWYTGNGGDIPGYIPYSPWRKGQDVGRGPWDSDWPNATVYPAIDEWPGNERYFSIRCAPMASEFTIHENIAPAAAIYGFLCPERGR